MTETGFSSLFPTNITSLYARADDDGSTKLLQAGGRINQWCGGYSLSIRCLGAQKKFMEDIKYRWIDRIKGKGEARTRKNFQLFL